MNISPSSFSLPTIITYLYSGKIDTLVYKTLIRPVHYHAIITILKLIVMLQPFCLSLANANTNLHPIILVPGNGGNQLEARLTHEYNPSSFICKMYPGRTHRDKDGWYRIWFDPTVLLAPYTKCFAERMMLYYDMDMDDYHNAPGVETRVPHFGSTKSLLYLDPNFKQISSYMGPLVNSLEQLGYVDEKTLFGAPYDFRYGLAAEGHPTKVGSKYLQQLKDLIESATTSNGGKRAIIISHSLGGLYVHQLLLRNPLSWRQKHIQHFISLSTPWGGTVQEMLAFASGYTLGVPLVHPLLVRQEQRSSESNLWLMPSPRAFGHSKPLVRTVNETYTARDVANFLIDIGFSEGVYPYETRILPLVEEMSAPNVPVTCIVGVGLKTPEMLFYDDRGFDEHPSIAWGDGDGTVNAVSLGMVEVEWMNEENQLLKMIRLDGVSHADVLKDSKSLDQILGVVSEINSHVDSSDVVKYNDSKVMSF